MRKFVVWWLRVLNKMVCSASLYSIFFDLLFADLHLLSDAFDKLKQNFQVNLVQSKDSIGQDIYVLLAESALDVRQALLFLATRSVRILS